MKKMFTFMIMVVTSLSLYAMDYNGNYLVTLTASLQREKEILCSSTSEYAIYSQYFKPKGWETQPTNAFSIDTEIRDIKKTRIVDEDTQASIPAVALTIDYKAKHADSDTPFISSTCICNTAPKYQLLHTDTVPTNFPGDKFLITIKVDIEKQEKEEEFPMRTLPKHLFAIHSNTGLFQ